MIQQLPAPSDDKRVETGPVQFGDDWPGLFVRGDDALALAMTVRKAIYGDPNEMDKIVLKAFAKQLESVKV